MSRQSLIEFLWCNEPVFTYNNREYSICYPNGNAICGPTDTDKEDCKFDSVEDLVDNLMIDGKPFREIADNVLKEYFQF